MANPDPNPSPNPNPTPTPHPEPLPLKVHGDGLASLLGDHDRSLLVGGVASVTLSAREAEARPDKLRQVSRRYGTAVFGTAVELRGYADLTPTPAPNPNLT